MNRFVAGTATMSILAFLITAAALFYKAFSWPGVVGFILFPFFAYGMGCLIEKMMGREKFEKEFR